MKTDYSIIIILIINLVILFSISVLIFKSIQGFRNYANRNKEMKKKIDAIQKKLENIEHN